MKNLFIIMFAIGFLISSETEMYAKNDTIILTKESDVFNFSSRFSIEYASLAKRDISLIKELDSDNYPHIIAQIKHLINNDECNPKTIIPYLKVKGSLRYVTAYKKMFLIYFRQMRGFKAWPQSIFYISDQNGRFLYVELKDVYANKNVVYDGGVLSDIMVTKKMLIYE